MSSSATTNRFREKLAAWVEARLAGAEIQWGDGGVNVEGEVLAADPEQSALNNSLFVNSIHSVSVIDDSHVKIVGRLDRSNLVGITVSEAGVFDADEDLLAVRNFGPKVKEDDEIYDVDFIILF